jgi:putative protein kinase ArgK-like GTPase of G3E family
VTDILKKLQAGDRRALSRLITLVENQSDKLAEYMSHIHGAIGDAYYLGKYR